MELARALAGRPRLLLLDETLAGLGREECDEVLAVLRGCAREGMTIVIIEHTMHAMLRLADRFLVLDHGRVLADGAPHAVVEDPRGDRGLSRLQIGWRASMLEVRDLSVSYGGLRALAGRVARGRTRPVRHRGRAERRRQDDPVQDASPASFRRTGGSVSWDGAPC